MQEARVAVIAEDRALVGLEGDDEAHAQAVLRHMREAVLAQLARIEALPAATVSPSA